MAKKRCYHCNYPLRYKYLVKQLTTTRCPSCKKELHATFNSKLTLSVIYIIPFAFILMTLESNFHKMCATLTWIIFNFLVIQPIVLKYK